jgi:hypothetical protein
MRLPLLSWKGDWERDGIITPPISPSDQLASYQSGSMPSGNLVCQHRTMIHRQMLPTCPIFKTALACISR